MRKLFALCASAVWLMAASPSVSGFGLLGTYADWMVQQIGYQQTFDMGGPMNLGEEYRYNLKTLYYGFDSTFLNYFGTRGVEAVEAAIQILNNLPEASRIDVNQFPLTSKRNNYKASALLLVDLKSTALTLMLEAMGLGQAERSVWTLRSAWQDDASQWHFVVVKRNFDPDTWQPTSYVNGTLYTYRIINIDPAPWFDAAEIVVDPLQPANSTVASGPYSGLPYYGEFYTGLTRDDAAGWKYLYGKNNYNIEPIPTSAYVSTNAYIGIPGYPIGLTNSLTGTNVTSTNTTTYLRSGVEQIKFVRANFDSYLGAFNPPVTNVWMDEGITNGTVTRTSLERVLTVPDFVFSAADLGLNADNAPIVVTRATDTTMVNNAALNGSLSATGVYGPGTMNPPNTITFSKIGPSYANGPGFLTEAGGQPQYVFMWGSFDGSTNAPIIFPNGTSIQEVEALVRRRR